MEHRNQSTNIFLSTVFFLELSTERVAVEQLFRVIFLNLNDF